MRLEEIDKTELILESYRIYGITASECRTIFLDWAIKLSPEFNAQEAVAFLLKTYEAKNPDHPMNSVLTEGLGTAVGTGRRGGRRGRVGG